MLSVLLKFRRVIFRESKLNLMYAWSNKLMWTANINKGIVKVELMSLEKRELLNINNTTINTVIYALLHNGRKITLNYPPQIWWKILRVI